MFVRSNEKNYLFLCFCLFFNYIYIYIYIFIYIKYKELELNKLEFHITRNLSLVSLSNIEGKKRRALCSSFVFTKNSSLLSTSIVLHGTRVYQA